MVPLHAQVAKHDLYLLAWMGDTSHTWTRFLEQGGCRWCFWPAAAGTPRSEMSNGQRPEPMRLEIAHGHQE